MVCLFLCKPPPFKAGSVHKVRGRFILVLPGLCFSSQFHRTYPLQRRPARTSVGLPGVSKGVHLAEIASVSHRSLGKKTRSTTRKTGIWRRQTVTVSLLSLKRPSLDFNLKSRREGLRKWKRPADFRAHSVFGEGRLALSWVREEKTVANQTKRTCSQNMHLRTSSQTFWWSSTNGVCFPGHLITTLPKWVMGEATLPVVVFLFL